MDLYHPFQISVLKMNTHCAKCEEKVKKLLQKVDGVHTIDVDAEHGKVKVLGNVDPYALILMLEKAGKRAELCLDETPAMDHHKQNITPLKRKAGEGTDKQMFCKTEQLQQLKLAFPEIVKVIFSGHKKSKNTTRSLKCLE